MIIAIEQTNKTETHERFHPLMFLPAVHYIEGMETLAAQVEERDKRRQAVSIDE